MPNPDAHRLTPDCKVSLAGKKLDLDKDARLTKVEVDLDVDLFGQCALTFNDPKLALINGQEFKAGAQVKVEIGFAPKLSKVFEGEVVALEPQFRRDLPPSLRVVCQESIHRLALKTATRALMEVDGKEIASKIAQEHGLTAQAPSGTKEHVLQANVSDATLLRRVAATSGNHLRIEGKKLVIGPPPKGEEITVAPGDGLKKMRVRIKAAGQIGEVTIHGWDPKAKREIVGKAKGEGETGEGSKKHGGSATLAFAADEHIPADVATAEAMAKGRMRKLAEGFVTAEVEMIGNAGVQPGAVLSFEKMGEQLEGKYRVEKARHAFDKHGYLVTFQAVRIGKKKPPKPAHQPSGSAPEQMIAPQQTSAETGGQPSQTPLPGSSLPPATTTQPAAAQPATSSAQTPAAATQPAAAVGSVAVEIRASDGSSPAPRVVAAGAAVDLAAVPAGGADGTFAWRTASANITLSGTSGKTVTVKAGKAASASLDAEAVEVTFTPKAGGAASKAVAKLSLITVEVSAAASQSAGFDDMAGVAGAVPHLCVEQTQTTKVRIKVNGGPGGDALFFGVADPSVADVSAPGSAAAAFDLEVSGKAKNKARVRVEIHAVDAKGGVCAAFEVDVYKKKKLEAAVFNVQDSRVAATTLGYPAFDIARAATTVSGWYAQAVAEMKLKDGGSGVMDVDFDDNGNGYLELEPAGTSSKQRKVLAKLSGSGQKVVIVKKLAWVFYLDAAAKAKDTTISVKSSYSGYMKFLLAGTRCTLGAGATAETVKVRRTSGTTVTLDAALSNDHPAGDGLLYELSGLSGNPLWVAESGKTEAKIRETIGHELGHSLLDWLDLEASQNLMHFSSGRTGTELRLKPLPQKYQSGTESQWDKVSR